MTKTTPTMNSTSTDHHYHHQIMMNDKSTINSKTIKFLYSYGGKILPRPTDGMLRYVGGMTRILAVDRSISYTELAVKFLDCCGSSMCLRCKLPDEDMDVLVSVTSDQDLASVIEEYDRANINGQKWIMIRAILHPNKSVKKVSAAPASPSPVNYNSASKPPKYPVVSNHVSDHRFAKTTPYSSLAGRFCRPAAPVAATYRRRAPAPDGFYSSGHDQRSS